MTFVVDEHAATVGSELRELGHTVLLVTEVLGARASDEDICRYAEARSAVIVTANEKDFSKRLSRRPTAKPRKYRCAGALYVSEKLLIKPGNRVKTFDALLRREKLVVAGVSDPRLLVRLTPQSLLVIR